jgi:uncharacterized protein YkwD
MFKRLLFLVALGLLVVGPATSASAGAYDHLLAPAATCPNQADTSLAVNLQEAAMLCLVNFARERSGLARLATDPRLMDSADRKAQDLMRCQQFSHTACGRAFDFHVGAAGYRACATGENIAWGSGGFGTVRNRMSGWLESSGHRANILSTRYRDQGIALIRGTFSGYSGVAMWVSQFGMQCAGAAPAPTPAPVPTPTPPTTTPAPEPTEPERPRRRRRWL